MVLPLLLCPFTSFVYMLQLCFLKYPIFCLLSTAIDMLGQTFGVNKNVIKIELISTPCLWLELKDPSVWPLRSKEQKDLLFMHKPWQTIESLFSVSIPLSTRSCIIEKKQNAKPGWLLPIAQVKQLVCQRESLLIHHVRDTLQHSLDQCGWCVWYRVNLGTRPSAQERDDWKFEVCVDVFVI